MGLLGTGIYEYIENVVGLFCSAINYVGDTSNNKHILQLASHSKAFILLGTPRPAVLEMLYPPHSLSLSIIQKSRCSNFISNFHFISELNNSWGSVWGSDGSESCGKLTGLAASGDLAHLLGEPLRSELAGQVVQGPRLAALHQPLQEEEQRQVAGHLVLERLHDDERRRVPLKRSKLTLKIQETPLIHGQTIAFHELRRSKTFCLLLRIWLFCQTKRHSHAHCAPSAAAVAEMLPNDINNKVVK